MDGAFSIDTNGQCGGVPMLWNNACNIDIQCYSLNNVDMLMETEGVDKFRFTGFYGFLKLSIRT